MFIAKVEIRGSAVAVVKFTANLTKDAKGLMQVIGRRVVIELRKHFFRIDATKANKNNWPRTHFWAAVARSVRSRPRVAKRSVTITVAHPVAAHKAGVGPNKGHIWPVRGQWLTIPSRAESYGKSVKEFKQDLTYNQRLVFINRDGVTAFLGVMEINRTEDDDPNDQRKSRNTEKIIRVVYVLKKHVFQKPDPDTLPSETIWAAAFTDESRRWLQLETSKAVAATKVIS